MANDLFKKALHDALILEFSNMLPDADENEHVFSSDFERKMQKLIKRRKKPYYKIINTLGKRVACIAVIVLVASSVTVLSVDALRNAVADFFVSIYEKFSTVQSVDEDKPAPTTIEDIYAITYNLDGYKVVFENNNEFSRDITYVNSDIIIEFSQYTKDMYNKNVNTEDAEISTTEINGTEAIIFLDNQNYYHIIINSDDYVFDFGSNIGKDALIDIAESVQKVESE